MFKPNKIYYEKEIDKYELGKYLLKIYSNIPKEIIDNHNNIEELRKKDNKEFPKLKRLLIIGVRKTQKFIPNYKVSNYLVPYTSSGCSAMCLYCYLVCNYNKCSYLRLFVNREELLNKIIKKCNESSEELVFEIGSNSDLILENTITHNLEWTIPNFLKSKQGYLTFPTKFHYVDSLLNLNHKGRIIIRMSVNPEYIINNIELGTSKLNDRIIAINKLVLANYKVGILIAPVILLPNWQLLYKELIIKLYNCLNDKAKKEVFFEIIFMTYSYVHKMINQEAFPNNINLYNKDIMVGRGMGKYMYNSNIKEESSIYLEKLVHKNFPNNKIIYIC